MLENVLRKGISGYKWFDIKVDEFVAPSEGTGNSGSSITWKWDCRKNDTGDTELVTRTITFLNPERRIMRFEYLVMSNAVEVKVEVNLLPSNHLVRHPKKQGRRSSNSTVESTVDDGDNVIRRIVRWYTATGEITACIDGYDHQIGLFSPGQDGVRIPHYQQRQQVTIRMRRSDVPVRPGKALRLNMKDVRITDDDNDVFVKKEANLSFEPASSTPRVVKSDTTNPHQEVQVKVTWPKLKETKVDLARSPSNLNLLDI